MPDRTDNKPYKGLIQEREERFTTGLVDWKKRPQSRRVF